MLIKKHQKKIEMVQHLSTPLLLSDDALGAYKDTPVSGSICRELKAGFCSITVIGCD